MNTVENIHYSLGLDENDFYLDDTPDYDLVEPSASARKQLNWVRLAKELQNFEPSDTLSLNAKNIAKNAKLRISHVSTIKISNKIVKQLQFHGNNILLSSLTNKVSLINVHTKSVHPINIESFLPIDMTFNCSSDLLYILGARSLIFYDLHGTYRQLTGISPSRLVKMTSHPEDMTLYSIASEDKLVGLYDIRTHTPISTYRLKSQCVGVGFAIKTNSLIAIDADSRMYRWSLALGRMEDISTINKLHKPTTLTMSNSSLCMVGTESGITGVLDIQPSATTIVKCFGNLTTQITSTAMYSGYQPLIGFCSPHKQNGIKLANLNYSVYNEWPNDDTNLGRVYSLTIGRQLAVGTVSGLVMLHNLY